MTTTLLSWLSRVLGYVHRSYLRPLLPKSRAARYTGLSSSFDFRRGDGVLPRWFRPSDVDDIEDYEEQLIAGLRAHVRPGNRVVVVGGGAGITSAIAANITGGDGAVICYEASRTRLDMVRECCRRNAVDHIVDLRFGTVGEAVHVYQDLDIGPLVHAHDLPECDVLELDCEGAERIVLAEMLIRPRVVIVETHGNYGSPTEAVRSQLAGLGYAVTDMGVAERRYASACVARDIRVLVARREP